MKQPDCRAERKDGASCRAPALPGRETCLSHTPELAAAVQEARRRGGTTAMKLRVLQGRRQRLETARALTRFLSDVMVDLLAGRVDVDTARTLAYCASVQKGLVEVADLERQVRELEQLHGQRKGNSA